MVPKILAKLMNQKGGNQMNNNKMYQTLSTFIDTTETLFFDSVLENCDELSTPIMNYVAGTLLTCMKNALYEMEWEDEEDDL